MATHKTLLRSPAEETSPANLGLREVFEAFRKEVLALDPCVSEEFMKLYVAYKAEWCRRPSDCALDMPRSTTRKGCAETSRTSAVLTAR